MDIYHRLNTEITDVSRVCQQWQITELALFGSVLRDDFNQNSDIDLLVTFAEEAKITFFRSRHH